MPIIVLTWWGALCPPHTPPGIGAFGADAEALGPVPDPFWAIEQMRNCLISIVRDLRASSYNRLYRMLRGEGGVLSFEMSSGGERGRPPTLLKKYRREGDSPLP